jgi:hypothetical protein
LAEKLIKVRLFTWFEEVDSPVHGQAVLTERIAHQGQVVDITNPAYVKRGEELDAFYTDAERKQIDAGTYAGPEADTIYRVMAGERPAQLGEETVAGEGSLDVSSASDQEIADYIVENRLSIDKTLSLIPEDADLETLEKFYDAEAIASDNQPRKGVADAIDKRIEDLKGK